MRNERWLGPYPSFLCLRWGVVGQAARLGSACGWSGAGKNVRRWSDCIFAYLPSILKRGEGSPDTKSGPSLPAEKGTLSRIRVSDVIQKARCPGPIAWVIDD